MSRDLRSRRPINYNETQLANANAEKAADALASAPKKAAPKKQIAAAPKKAAPRGGRGRGKTNATATANTSRTRKPPVKGKAKAKAKAKGKASKTVEVALEPTSGSTLSPTLTSAELKGMEKEIREMGSNAKKATKEKTPNKLPAKTPSPVKKGATSGRVTKKSGKTSKNGEGEEVVQTERVGLR